MRGVRVRIIIVCVLGLFVSCESKSDANQNKIEAGIYQWDHTKFFIGSDRELMVNDSIMIQYSSESYLPSDTLYIIGDNLKNKDGQNYHFYITEEGINIILHDQGRHEVWSKVK